MPKQPKQSIQHSAPMTKRQRARWEQEQAKQRQVIAAVLGVLGFAALLLIGGVVWDKWYIPNKTVATVAGQDLSNAEYQRFRQITQAQQALNAYSQFAQYQRLQLQGGEQFQEQIDASMAALKQPNAPLDYSIVDQMIEQRLLINGSNAEGVSVTDDELQQSLAGKFAPAADPDEATAAVSDTAALSATNPLSTTADVATPTLTAPEATAQVDKAIQNYYTTLKDFVENPQYGHVVSTLPFGVDEFKAYVLDAERAALLRERIGEKLVPETSVPTEPYFDVDHLDIPVTVPQTETAAISETVWQAGKTEIDAAYAELQKGTAFDVVAARYVGATPDSKPDDLQPISYFASFSITEPVTNQQVGVIGEPYRSPVGWHIVRVNKREERPNQTELSSKRSEALTAWLEQQRAAANIEIFPAPTATPEPPTMDPALLGPTTAPDVPPDQAPPASDESATPTP